MRNGYAVTAIFTCLVIAALYQAIYSDVKGFLGGALGQKVAEENALLLEVSIYMLGCVLWSAVFGVTMMIQGIIYRLRTDNLHGRWYFHHAAIDEDVTRFSELDIKDTPFHLSVKGRNVNHVDHENESLWHSTISEKTKTYLTFGYEFYYHAEQQKQKKAGIVKVALTGQLKSGKYPATYWDYEPEFRTGNMTMVRTPMVGKPVINTKPL